jgi:radical SAM protein with 4Fe4S-binding SPASM domain
MYGWGARQLTIAPDGKVLPCPAATAIRTLELDNVHDSRLADIWYRSSSFNAYRGEDWMQEPCRTCDRRSIDFGGCRPSGVPADRRRRRDRPGLREVAAGRDRREDPRFACC